MIKLENVSYSVKGKNIIKNINLTFKPGEMVFITGSSGAGKTSLLNLLGGIDRVSGGKIFFEDRNITGNIDDYRSRNVGFIFQNYNLISGMSALDNIRMAVEYASLKEDNSINEEMTGWNIKDPFQKSDSLSGGEKQRIAILRAMLKESRVILGDEPTGNLDPANSDMVCRELKKLKHDRYIIIVTHNIDLADKYADRVITIEDGLIVSDVRKDDHEPAKAVSFSHKQKSKSGHLKADMIVIKNSLKRRWWILLLMSFVVSFSLSVLLMGVSLSKYNKFNMQKLNLDYLEADMITVRNNDKMYGTMIGFSGFFDATIDKVSSLGIAETVYIYSDNLNYTFAVDENERDGYFKQINIDEFFKNRIMGSGVKGDFLKDKYDIIIASDVAQYFFGTDDCIGKKISVLDNFDVKTEYNIVGVNYVKDINDKIKSYISADSRKDVLKEYKSMTNSTAISLKESEKKPTPYIALGDIMSVSDDLKLIEGRLPNSDDEVVVNVKSIAYASKIEPEQVDVKAWYDEYANKEYVAIINGRFDFKVVGVVETNEDMKSHIYFTKKAIEKASEVRPSILQVYVSDIDDIDRTYNSLDEMYDIYPIIDNENAKDMILDQNNDSDRIIGILGYTVVAIASLILTSFIVISVIDRRRDIGIVKSLGAKGKDICILMTADGVVLCTLIWILSFALTKIMIAKVPGYLKGYKEMLFTFPSKEYLMFLAVMSIGILSAFFIAAFIYIFKKCSSLLKEM